VNRTNNDCLPIARVVEIVAEVEAALENFYSAALERLTDEEDVRLILTQLRRSKKDKAEKVRKVCAAAACGTELTDKSSDRDLDFLSALVQSAFYNRTGLISELLDPALGTRHLVDNALKLERDLMLFYIKFYAVSCDKHRPLFSELIHRSEDDLTELGNLRFRLLRAERQN